MESLTGEQNFPLANCDLRISDWSLVVSSLPASRMELLGPARVSSLPFGGYLVLYVDMGQGTARWLDNPAESPPLGDAVPRHRLDSLNTGTDFQKKKKRTRHCDKLLSSPCIF